ncbi:DUF6193 family natural product biosynthesis protein [Saccharopolyspora indica]|uniref:DUF6193 family natural product biosynthesis protein n=1 Tax=Saccharopolyspora indica TaxID=1229659 RepID=UPI00356536CF
MFESSADEWRNWELIAEARDRRSQDSSPSCSDLVRAARATSLHRLFPFFSMNSLCFSTLPEALGLVAPAFVVMSREGEYVIWRGDPKGGEHVRALSTREAVVAAEKVEFLLDGWPASSDDSGQ